MLNVEVSRSGDMPRQAWLAVRRGSSLAVLAGDGVTVSDGAVYEGGWALTDGPGALNPAGIHLGSGVVWGHGGEPTLVAPSHALEAVWTAETPGATYGSNSLAMLAAASCPAGIDVWRARHAIRSVEAGIHDYRREVYRGADLRICRFVNAFVALPGAGAPVERQQVQSPAFDGYAGYLGFLQAALRDALASHGGAMTVYLSRGYDSPAVAVLGRDTGPVEAICIDRTATGAADDGQEIAARLGIPSRLVARKSRESRVMRGEVWTLALETIEPADFDQVFEFFNGVGISEECQRVDDRLIAGRAVLSGWYGDTIWGLDGEPNSALGRALGSSIAGGFGEYRLRTGFMHVPVPAFGFSAAAAIRAISASAEMAPWRVGGGYDRPIPRRIVEEAGVPRGAFGVRKQFTATKPANLHRIAAELFAMQTARYVDALASWAPRPVRAV